LLHKRLMTVGDALCAAAIGWGAGTNLGWALIPSLGLWAILLALLASCGVTHLAIRVLLAPLPGVPHGT